MTVQVLPRVSVPESGVAEGVAIGIAETISGVGAGVGAGVGVASGVTVGAGVACATAWAGFSPILSTRPSADPLTLRYKASMIEYRSASGDEPL